MMTVVFLGFLIDKGEINQTIQLSQEMIFGNKVLYGQCLEFNLLTSVSCHHMLTLRAFFYPNFITLEGLMTGFINTSKLARSNAKACPCRW